MWKQIYTAKAYICYIVLLVSFSQSSLSPRQYRLHNRTAIWIWMFSATCMFEYFTEDYPIA